MGLTSVLWIMIFILHNNFAAVLKDTSNHESCKERIREIEQAMVRSFGHQETKEWLDKVKSSPETYVMHEKPIIAELANAIIDEKISTIDVREIYIQMQEMKKQLNELKTKLDQISNGENEVPVNVDFGTLATTVGTYTFQIPDSIPSDAKKILLYIYFQSGGCSPDIWGDIEIISNCHGKDYNQFFTFHTYSQNAWSYNSDSFWLPLPENRKIIMKINMGKTKYGGNCAGYFRLIRYSL
eukprot:87673_1